MQKYDAVVIGAGNGGLAAACRMAKGGKKTLLVDVVIDEFWHFCFVVSILLYHKYWQE